jgi:two-component system, chemotaxis family, sensor histidine kinase and response regulator PixL
MHAVSWRLSTLKLSLDAALVVDSELETHLLQAFDCLRLPLTQQLTQGSFDGDQALAQAEPILQNLEQRLASAMAETENFIPSSSDLGFDMATSIFEIDVQQGLDHLAGVLAQPETHEVAGELRAQAEIFMGFAELLDLSGFAQIAQTTLDALAANPDQAVEITRLAVADFSQGRAAVLAASSTTGGKPSAALQALAANSSPPAALPELPLEPIAEQFLTAVFGDQDFADQDFADQDEADLDTVDWDAALSADDDLAWLTQAQISPETDLALPAESTASTPAPLAFANPNDDTLRPEIAPSLDTIFGPPAPIPAAENRTTHPALTAPPNTDLPPDTSHPPIHPSTPHSPTSPLPTPPLPHPASPSASTPSAWPGSKTSWASSPSTATAWPCKPTKFAWA